MGAAPQQSGARPAQRLLRDRTGGQRLYRHGEDAAASRAAPGSAAGSLRRPPGPLLPLGPAQGAGGTRPFPRGLAFSGSGGGGDPAGGAGGRAGAPSLPSPCALTAAVTGGAVRRVGTSRRMYFSFFIQRLVDAQSSVFTAASRSTLWGFVTNFPIREMSFYFCA